MQPKIADRELAIALRRKGLSYSEIQQTVPVSQASLSLWLRSIRLTARQKNRLMKLALVGQAAGAAARRQQRLNRLGQLVQEVNIELPPLLLNPFFTLGLALYWAEGSKEKPWSISKQVRFSNSDPNCILIMRAWLQKFCGILKQDFVYSLHIHITANTDIARQKWAKILGCSPNNIAIYLKKHEVRSRHQHDHYIGLIQMGVRRSAWLNRRIELWTKGAIAAFLN